MKFSKNKISIAIPTYNSSKYVKDCLLPIAKSNLISEIVINDDFSEEEDYKQLKNIISLFSYNTDIPIKIFRNSHNLGAFKNKLVAVQNCSSDIVYQLDSDNIPMKNIDKIITKIQEFSEPQFLYLPSKIYQFTNKYKSSKFKSIYNKKYKVRLSKKNKIIDTSIVKDFYKNNTPYTVDKNLGWVLNLGNFITYKNIYLKFLKDVDIHDNSFFAADAMAISYYFLKNNSKLQLIEGFYHYHRKRSDSVSFTSGENTKLSYDYFKENFLKL